MILISLIVFLWVVANTMQTQKEMDTALDYVGLAATMGISTYVLAQLAGGSANRQLYHCKTMAMAVGIATGVGSMVAKAAMVMSSLISLRLISGRQLSQPCLMQDWPVLVPGAMLH